MLYFVLIVWKNKKLSNCFQISGKEQKIGAYVLRKVSSIVFFYNFWKFCIKCGVCPCLALFFSGISVSLCRNRRNFCTMKKISNEQLSVCVNDKGAELCSVVRNSDGREFLWQANPEYWGRHSPVLFPIVGSLWNKEMHQDGAVYHMNQHGFARDSEFELIAESLEAVRYRLKSSDATKQLYPYDFELEIGYRLNGNKIAVEWQVRNTGVKKMHFQIGAHPAFNYKDYEKAGDVMGYLKFDTARDSYRLSLLGQKGCLSDRTMELKADKGLVPITKTTFAIDTLLIEHNQLQTVELLDSEKCPYLRVSFDAPLIGIWSPRKDEYAPFICIEPWYGRCDREEYTGEYADRDWTQHLEPGEVFNASYTIEIL